MGPARRWRRCLWECGLRERHGNAAVGDVARGADELAPGEHGQQIVQAGLGVEIERGRLAPQAAENDFGELRGAESGEVRCGFGVGCIGFRAPPRFALKSGKRILADGRRIERNLELWVGLFAARNRPEQHDGVFLALEVRGHGFGHVIENADNAEDRAWDKCLRRAFRYREKRCRR